MTISYSLKLLYLATMEKIMALVWPFISSTKPFLHIKAHQNIDIKLTRFGFLSKRLFEQRFAVRHRLSFEYEVIDEIRRLVHPNLTVLDVGANIGVISIIIAKELGAANGMIYAFEPVVETYNALIKNINLNNFQDRISPVNMALSDKTTDNAYMVSPNAADSDAYKYISPSEKADDGFEKVASMSLDEWYFSNNIGKITLIKIDIEGGEMLFFKGATRFFESNRPVIIFECVSSALLRYGFFINDVFKFLDVYNYSISSIDDANWIARPK